MVRVITAVSPQFVVNDEHRTWDSIASECTNFIGPADYGYVQREQ